MNRWVVYQRERFPLLAHGPLVAAFSSSAVCFSSLLRGHVAPPAPATLIVAFTTSLLFFLQLRIADEFKDAAADARYRPYRPVPRGLVSLRELGLVAVAAAVVQLMLALWLDRGLVALLLVVWAYLAVMTREFFVGRWLKQHPAAYMASHLLIVPLIDLYATACDWQASGLSRPPAGLSWFLVVSFFNGLVVEIGRKTRVPQDEEAGVETYSALWGTAGAAGAWVAAVLLTGAAAWRASATIGTDRPTLWLLALLAALCAMGARRLVVTRRPGSGRLVEAMSGVWTLVMYLGLGAGPLTLAIVAKQS